MVVGEAAGFKLHTKVVLLLFLFFRYRKNVYYKILVISCLNQLLDRQGNHNGDFE